VYFTVLRHHISILKWRVLINKFSRSYRENLPDKRWLYSRIMYSKIDIVIVPMGINATHAWRIAFILYKSRMFRIISQICNWNA
jgi:hypothetical protein